MILHPILISKLDCTIQWINNCSQPELHQADQGSIQPSLELLTVWWHGLRPPAQQEHGSVGVGPEEKHKDAQKGGERVKKIGVDGFI